MSIESTPAIPVGSLVSPVPLGSPSDVEIVGKVKRVGEAIAKASMSAAVVRTQDHPGTMKTNPKKFFGDCLESTKAITYRNIESIYEMMGNTPITSNVTLFHLFGTNIISIFDKIAEIEYRIHESTEISEEGKFEICERFKKLSLLSDPKLIQDALEEIIQIYAYLDVQICKLKKCKQTSDDIESLGCKLTEIISAAGAILVESRGNNVIHKIVRDFPGHQILNSNQLDLKSITCFLDHLASTFSDLKILKEWSTKLKLASVDDLLIHHTIDHKDFFKEIDETIVELLRSVNRLRGLHDQFAKRKAEEKDGTKKIAYDVQLEKIKSSIQENEQKIDALETARRVYEGSICKIINPEIRSRFEVVETVQNAIAYMNDVSKKLLVLKQDPSIMKFASLFSGLDQEFLNCFELLDKTSSLTASMQKSLHLMKPIFAQFRDIGNRVVEACIPEMIKIIKESPAPIDEKKFLENFQWIATLCIALDDLKVLFENSTESSLDEILEPFAALLDLTASTVIEPELLEDQLLEPEVLEDTRAEFEELASPSSSSSIEEESGYSSHESPSISDQGQISPDVRGSDSEEYSSGSREASPTEFGPAPLLSLNPEARASVSPRPLPSAKVKSKKIERAASQQVITKNPKSEQKRKQDRKAAIELNVVKRGGLRGLEKFLSEHGWRWDREAKGSHTIYKHADGRQLTVPIHKTFAIGTISSIVNTALGKG